MLTENNTLADGILFKNGRTEASAPTGSVNFFVLNLRALASVPTNNANRGIDYNNATIGYFIISYFYAIIQSATPAEILPAF